MTALTKWSKPWPVCDKCKKPVDAVEEIYLPHVYSTVYRVRCHGDFEEATLADYALEDNPNIRYELAFIQPKLIEAEPKQIGGGE